MSKIKMFILGLVFLASATARGMDQPEPVSSQSPEEREASAKAVALVAAWEAIPEKEKNTENARALVESLTALGPNCVPGIATALDAAAGKDSIAIIPLITVVIRMKAKAAGPALVRIIKESANENFKRNAMNGAASIQYHEAIPTILAIVTQPPLPVEKRIQTDDGYLDLNFDAIVALQKLGKSFDGVSTISREILRVLFSSDEQQKHRYIQILGELPYTESENILLALLSDTSVEVRHAALGALGRIGNPGLAVKVAGQLLSAEPRIRSAAAVALGKMKYLPSIPQLVPLLKDPSNEVSSAALWSLRKLSGMQFPADEECWKVWYEKESSESQQKFDFLVNQVKTGPRELAPIAVEELTKLVLMRDKMLPVLRTLVEHEEFRVRAASCNALAQVGGSAALQVLALKLNDRSPEVANAAWRGLKYATGQKLPFDYTTWKGYLDKRGG